MLKIFVASLGFDMRKILTFILLTGLAGCAGEVTKIVPGIVPNTAKQEKIVVVHPNNVIGEVEPIYILPMKSPFLSRIDTGATTSSIDASNIKRFERDGENWVSFDIVNKETEETYHFEKPLAKRIRIKRIGDDEHRLLVELDVKMGEEKFKAEFTLAERPHFDYQALVGRNILNGRMVVDVSLSNTLK